MLGQQTNLTFLTLSIGQLVIQARGLPDRSSCSALLSEKCEKPNRTVAATPNATPPNSAALPPTDQQNVAARPHRNPLGRQIQAIRRVRLSTTEARSGLCFLLHHKGYRIPILAPNDDTISSIRSGERPAAIKIGGNGRSPRTTKPNRAFRRRRRCSYSCQLSPIIPIVESLLFLSGRALDLPLRGPKQLFQCCYTYSIMDRAVQH
jgi:hypothetical protein